MVEQKMNSYTNPYNIKGRRHITAEEVNAAVKKGKSPPVLKSPEDTFSLYSTTKEVIMAQGPPDDRATYDKSRREYKWYVLWPSEHQDRFYYPCAYQGFLCNGPVTNRGYLTVNKSGISVWSYGSSKVLFGAMPDCNCAECRKPEYVLAWFNAGELKLTNFAKLEPLFIRGRYISYEARGLPVRLNYGMTIEDVLQSQGNPVLIIPESVTTRTGTSPHTCMFTIDWNSNFDVGTLRFYYGVIKRVDENTGVGHQQRVRAGLGFDRVESEVSQSEVVITPSFQIDPDIEFAKEHKKARVRSIEQTVLAITDNGDLSLAETKEVEERKLITEKESKIRWLALMEMQELFEFIQAEHKAILEQNARNQEIREEAKEKKALENFLNETVNANTYDKGLRFELFCKKLFESMGWKVEHSGQSGDLGIDLRGEKADALTSIKVVVQCKHQDSVSADVAIQTHGIADAEGVDKGIIITTGTFTADAKKFGDGQPQVELIDGVKLRELSKQYLKT